jgi:hypothetical protein
MWDADYLDALGFKTHCFCYNCSKPIKTLHVPNTRGTCKIHCEDCQEMALSKLLEGSPSSVLGSLFGSIPTSHAPTRGANGKASGPP